MLKIITDGAESDDLAAALDELVANGAPVQVLMTGLKTEIAENIERHGSLVDEAGHRYSSFILPR